MGDTVIYATENDVERPTKEAVDPMTGMPMVVEAGPSAAERGLYDHGMYPYVFDALYPVEGSPCGYGYVDLCRSPQTTIDILNTSFVQNAQVGARSRYFSSGDGAINEEEFLDLSKPIVHVSGRTDENSLRVIQHNPLDSNYINVYDRAVQELRETSGNTETSTGNVSSGVTAASAIAALQEASGKGSKDSTRAAYRAYGQIVEICIELIRQFYDMPRQFRILGQYGAEQYVSYTNAKLQQQAQGSAFGQDNGFRLPVFDIKVSAQKKNVYTKVTQNELDAQLTHPAKAQIRVERSKHGVRAGNRIPFAQIRLILQQKLLVYRPVPYKTAKYAHVVHIFFHSRCALFAFLQICRKCLHLSVVCYVLIHDDVLLTFCKYSLPKHRLQCAPLSSKARFYASVTREVLFSHCPI